MIKRSERYPSIIAQCLPRLPHVPAHPHTLQSTNPDTPHPQHSLTHPHAPTRTPTLMLHLIHPFVRTIREKVKIMERGHYVVSFSFIVFPSVSESTQLKGKSSAFLKFRKNNFSNLRKVLNSFYRNDFPNFRKLYYPKILKKPEHFTKKKYFPKLRKISFPKFWKSR